MMKKRLLIVEPSEVIVAGLKAMLDGQIRFKVLEPEMSADHLDERMIAARPDVVLINPTLIGSPDLLHHEHEVAVVALVYQYVERDCLKTIRPRATTNSPSVRRPCWWNWPKARPTRRLPMPST